MWLGLKGIKDTITYMELDEKSDLCVGVEFFF